MWYSMRLRPCNYKLKYQYICIIIVVHSIHIKYFIIIFCMEKIPFEIPNLKAFSVFTHVLTGGIGTRVSLAGAAEPVFRQYL